MSTSPDTATFILDQLSDLGPLVRVRSMFGEYALYCGDKTVGFICDDQLFIKITDPGRKLMGDDYEEGAPYPGAKPYILVGDSILENRDRLVELIRVTEAVVPLPKPKRVRSPRKR